MTIGILDAGTGGLAIARVLRQHLPQYDFLYFGHTARAPLGEHRLESVTRALDQGLALLHRQGALLTVISSHTLAAAYLLAAPAPEPRVPVPVLEILTPAAEYAATVSRGGVIGVLASPLTVASGVHAACVARLRPTARVFMQATPLLTALVEQEWTRRPETARIAKAYLRPLSQRQIDTLIPASSACLRLTKLLARKAGRRVRLIDPAAVLAMRLVHSLAQDPTLEQRLGRQGSLRAIVSELTPLHGRNAASAFGAHLSLEQLSP